jgi:Tol biopolymer transport system component
LNGDETGVDCGGSCPACPSCDDGLQNQGESGVDCGGPCAPCPCTWSTFGAPEQITGLNLDVASSQWGPGLSTDGLTLYFSSSTTSTEDLYSATRTDRGSAFTAAVALTTLNTVSNEGSPWLSVDGLRLYFYSDRAGGTGGRDLYFATRTDLVSSFGSVTAVGGVNSTSIDDLEWLSSDELDIYFSSARSPSVNTDLWVAHRSARTSPFLTPVPVAALESTSSDESPSLTSDQLSLFFVSNRAGGSGKYDIWMATRVSAASPFGNAVPVPVINSADDELHAMLSADGTEIIFTSDRAAGTTTHTLWHALRTCD